MLIIDGHNVIHLMSNLPLGRDHWKPFVAQVEQFATMTRKKIIVALDLPEKFPDVTSTQVELVCRQPADEVIKELLSQYRGGSGNVLVSSDRELQRRAHACGFRTQESRDFLGELNALDNREPGREKPLSTSSQEVAFWEHAFRSRPRLNK